MGDYRSSRRALILLVIFALTLQGAFIAQSNVVPEGGEYGGQLRVALKSVVTNSSLNPLTATDDDSWKIIDIMYDSLFRIKTTADKGLYPEPWLAESWTVVDDNTVTVNLRQNVKWHDGSDVTADDVAYSFSGSGMGGSTKYSTLLTDLSATPVGTHSVTFDLTNFVNKGLFFTKVMTVPIIPDTFGLGSDENGCGPFKLVGPSSSGQIQVTDEMILLNPKGDETRASMKHRFVTGVTVKDESSTWTPVSDYKLDSDSGSIQILTPPTAGSNVTATYTYEDRALTLEAFEDYFNGKPYLGGIDYTFYPDNPDTVDFNEAADKAIIDLIFKNIDLIGFELTSAEVSGDRYLDVENDEVTKLADETWKTVAEFPSQAEANAMINSNPQRTLRSVIVWNVEENITGTWTVVASFDNENDAKEYITNNITQRAVQVWEVQEFFLALDDNPGFRILYLGMNTQSAPLDDQAFRFALSNLMDRTTFQSVLGTGKETGYSLVIPQNPFWYNQSIPRYKLERDKDNDPILGPAEEMLSVAGYKDFPSGPPPGTSDGFRNLPNGDEFNLTLLIPPITTNSIESTIGTAMGDILNRAGIQTFVQQHEFTDITDNVTADTYDLALGILETDVDPSFMFDLFHSTRIGAPIDTNVNNFEPVKSVDNETTDTSTNPVILAKTNLESGAQVFKNGVPWGPGNYTLDPEKGELDVSGPFEPQNDTINITYEYRQFDHLLEKANGALDLDVRQGYVWETLSAVADEVPMIPLVYYHTLEAYDQTTYEGWVGMPGGINNFWSYINVKYVLLGSLTVDMSPVDIAMFSGDETTLVVTAKDEDGVGLENVYVRVFEDDNLGVFGEAEGFTDVNGEFTTSYQAHNVTQGSEVNIRTIAVKPQYSTDSDEDQLAIYPKTKELLVSVTRPSPKMDSGNSTSITVVVLDKATSLPAQGAYVRIDVSPSGLDTALSPIEGTTDAAGTFQASFSADVTTETFFRFSAKVSLEGYEETQTGTSIKVEVPFAPSDEFPILEAALGVLIVVLLILLLLMSRMGRPKTEKPDEEPEVKEESEAKEEPEQLEDSEKKVEPKEAETKEEGDKQAGEGKTEGEKAPEELDSEADKELEEIIKK
jgi:ABC-type transport system substrate-binding protein